MEKKLSLKNFTVKIKLRKNIEEHKVRLTDRQKYVHNSIHFYLKFDENFVTTTTKISFKLNTHTTATTMNKKNFLQLVINKYHTQSCRMPQPLSSSPVYYACFGTILYNIYKT